MKLLNSKLTKHFKN